jgi:hypothetical protein
MSTLIKLVISSLIGCLMLSCNINFGTGIDGNRNVVTMDRNISSEFESVKVSQGLDLYVTQGNTVDLSVEADENLHELIQTEVENKVLKIYTTENIRRAASRRINLTVTSISAIKATSGSDVVSTNTIKTDALELNATSGADINIDVETNSINCHSTSGSDISLSGSTALLVAEATSGSDIKASNLKAEISKVKASSGADIAVHTTQELTARATSGADIRYSGNPAVVNKSDSSSGSVSAQ